MADSFDQQLAVARVYADALFALAREADAIDATRAELDELLALHERDADFAAFLASAGIDADRRATSLERMFRGKLSDNVLNALQIMNQHGRGDLLPALHRRFVLAQEDAANEIEVVATSAAALSDEQQRQITQTAADLSGKRPVIEFVVDPEVLGGLVLQIDDWRYDYSLRRQLRSMQQQLAERSDRGLKVGVVQ